MIIMQDFVLAYMNHLDMWSECPPCLQLWHHENQFPKATICAESVSLVVVVPMYIKQSSHLGKGFRQFGQQDIWNWFIKNNLCLKWQSVSKGT